MVLSRSFRFGLSVIQLVRHQYILAEEQQASSAQEKSGSALNLDLAPNPGVDPPFCAVIDRATLAQHTPHLLRALWTYSQEGANRKPALWERRSR
jgi:hypothetical protein